MPSEVKTELSIDPRQADPSVVVKRIRVLASAEQVGLVDGQSKILNWVHNWLLSRLKADYGRFCDLGDMLNYQCMLDGESDELQRERWELYQRIFSKYWLRDLLPELKQEHPFVGLVSSVALKNVALRLTESFKQWRKRRGDGYGFPKFKSWSRAFCSLEYDERQGWNAQGRKLRLSFGKRIVPEAEMDKSQHAQLRRMRKTDSGAVLKKLLGLDLVLAEAAPRDAHRIEVVKEGGNLYVVFTRKVRLVKPCAKVDTYAYLDPNHKNLVYGLSQDGQAFEVANRQGLKAQGIRIDRLKSKRDHAVRRCELVQYTRDDGSVHMHWNPSNAWFRRNRAVLREEAKRRDQNKTFLHTVLHRLFDRYDAVGLGDYTPEAKDHRLGSTARHRKKSNRSINNNSLLGALQRALPQVAAKRGRRSYVMNERGTTRTCHICSYVVEGGIKPGIRSWLCPGCGVAHIRDENACQNGLGRLESLLRGDDLLGNRTCDALASDGHPCSDAQVHPGVAVACRCDWTFDLDGSCAIVEIPQEFVGKLLASARHVEHGKDRVQMKPREGDDLPDMFIQTYQRA